MSIIINTEGIVLHSFKYGDTSIITRIYTKELGLQSYLVPGVRKKRSAIKFNLFQPLSMFEMVVYHKQRDGLQRIKEISTINKYKNIQTDIRKTTIAIFLSEVLLNCLKEQESNPRMFEFLKQSFLFLDNSNEKIADFHLAFLWQLTKYLGFYPNLNRKAQDAVFNLQEGVYQLHETSASHCIDSQLDNFFVKMCSIDYRDLKEIALPAKLRRSLLEKTIEYYKLHIGSFSDIKSLSVLENVLN